MNGLLLALDQCFELRASPNPIPPGTQPLPVRIVPAVAWLTKETFPGPLEFPEFSESGVQTVSWITRPPSQDSTGTEQGSFRVQQVLHQPKALQPRLKVLDEVAGYVGGIGERVGIGEARVLDPGDVEAGAISGEDLFERELSPPSLEVLLKIPRSLSLVPVGRLIAGDEVGEVLISERGLLEGMVDIGTIVVDPDLSGPRLLGGGMVVEEEDIVRYDDRSLAVGFEEGADVLDEVELLVARRRPEVLAVVDELFPLLQTLTLGFAPPHRL